MASREERIKKLRQEIETVLLGAGIEMRSQGVTAAEFGTIAVSAVTTIQTGQLAFWAVAAEIPEAEVEARFVKTYKDALAVSLVVYKNHLLIAQGKAPTERCGKPNCLECGKDVN